MNIRRIAAGLLGISALGLALFAALCATISFDVQSYREIIFFFASIAVISIVAGLLSLALDWRIGIVVLLIIAIPTGYALLDALRRLGLLSF